MKILKLTSKKWSEFKDIRLEALKLVPQAFGDSYSVLARKDNMFWRSELGLKSPVWYGVVDKSGIIAIGCIKYAKALKFSHIAKLSGIYVAKEFRGRGIGSLLVKALIETAFSNSKIRKLKLIVNISQSDAIALYKNFKFKKVGDLKEEFNIDGVFYDAYLMELQRRR